MHNRGRLFLFALICLAAGMLIGCLYKNINTERNREEEDYIEISTAGEYWDFWEQAAENANIRGRLMKDITLNDLSDYDSWRDTPPEHLSPEVQCFAGVFDGNGYTIYGLYSENGYGFVKENSGVIQNLTVRDSMITGGYSNSGICYANYRKISNCRFEGELVSREEVLGRLAGVCIINYGFLEKCGYAGKMTTPGYLLYPGDMAGICAENRCSIWGCYNFTRNTKPYYSNAYAISDMGVENCYVSADGGWKISEGNHIIKLEKEQFYAISRLIEGDVNPLIGDSLWESDLGTMNGRWYAGKQEEALADQVVSQLIRRLVEQDRADFAEIGFRNLTEQQVESQGFHVELEIGWQAIEVEACPAEGIIDDYERLMKTCAACLGEADSWSHQTYQLTRFFERPDGTYYLTQKELEAFLEPEMLVFYQTETERGFFYAVGEMLYRITPSSSLLWEQILEGLCGERKAGDGISWDDQIVRQAAYRQLQEDGNGTNLFCQEEEESPVFCREEIMELTQLTITGTGSVGSFDDLKYMPELAELYLSGFEENSEGKSTRLRFNPGENLPQLKSLIIEGSWIKKRKVNWSALPNLESLTLIQCWVADMDELGCMDKLEVLQIYNIVLEDTSFLENMPLLTELSLEGCNIKSLDEIIQCGRLQKLSLSSNKIEDISGLSTLTELEELNMQANFIEDIEELSLLGKLKRIDLSANRISDFSPLWEKQGLEALYLLGNPARNWENLIYVPDVTVGGVYLEEENEKVQQALEHFHPNEDIYIEDAAAGDCNQDGIEDLAVVGFQVTVQIDGDAFFGGGRRVYLFLGTEKGFEEVQTLYLPVPAELNEDNWSSVKDGLSCTAVLSGNHLVVQTYSSGSEEDVNAGGSFRITDIYTWDKNQMKPEYRNETEYDSADR